MAKKRAQKENVGVFRESVTCINYGGVLRLTVTNLPLISSSSLTTKHVIESFGRIHKFISNSHHSLTQQHTNKSTSVAVSLHVNNHFAQGMQNSGFYNLDGSVA